MTVPWTNEAPFAGLVIVTVGGVLAGAVTVIETCDDPGRPPVSVTVATITWAPSAVSVRDTVPPLPIGVPLSVH